MIVVLTAVSLVLATAIIGVVALYLILIFVALKRTADHLQALADELVNIQADTAPLEDRVLTINGGLGALLGPLLAVNDNLAAIVDVARAGERR